MDSERQRQLEIAKLRRDRKQLEQTEKFDSAAMLMQAAQEQGQLWENRSVCRVSQVFKVDYPTRFTPSTDLSNDRTFLPFSRTNIVFYIFYRDAIDRTFIPVFV